MSDRLDLVAITERVQVALVLGQDVGSTALASSVRDVVRLIAEVARLRAARGRTARRLLAQREVIGLLEDAVETWRELHHALEDENARLRATLTFYADEATWVGPVVGDVGTGGMPLHAEPPVADDRGRRARAALGETSP